MEQKISGISCITAKSDVFQKIFINSVEMVLNDDLESGGSETNNTKPITITIQEVLCPTSSGNINRLLSFFHQPIQVVVSIWNNPDQSRSRPLSQPSSRSLFPKNPLLNKKPLLHTSETGSSAPLLRFILSSTLLYTDVATLSERVSTRSDAVTLALQVKINSTIIHI